MLPFSPECAPCGALAHGGVLKGIDRGIAEIEFRCQTCGPGFGGWATLLSTAGNHWQTLSKKSRGVYLMRRSDAEPVALDDRR